MATALYSERDEPIASVLTRTLLETRQEVPDFLQQYIPQGDAAENPKFETESDFDPNDLGAQTDGNLGGESGWGADNGATDNAAWGAGTGTTDNAGWGTGNSAPPQEEAWGATAPATQGQNQGYDQNSWGTPAQNGGNAPQDSWNAAQQPPAPPQAW